MKRKTNLFYTTGPDSKFITFSNYTESLTGNFLSTDTKLYPSRFIAVYIKGLNKDTKPALIKYLAAYYESKLAVIRDHFVNNRGDVETSVTPLNYLLDAMMRIRGFIKKDDGSYEIDYVHSINNSNNISDDESETSPVVEFRYISDITEQDYNGTYADTICCIDLNDYVKVVIDKTCINTDTDDNIVTFERPDTLYGWDDIPEEYADVTTIPDSIGGLDLDELLSVVLVEEDDSSDDVLSSDSDSSSSSSSDSDSEEPAVPTYKCKITDTEGEQGFDDESLSLTVIGDEVNIEIEDTESSKEITITITNIRMGNNSFEQWVNKDAIVNAPRQSLYPVQESEEATFNRANEYYIYEKENDSYVQTNQKIKIIKSPFSQQLIEPITPGNPSVRPIFGGNNTDTNDVNENAVINNEDSFDSSDNSSSDSSYVPEDEKKLVIRYKINTGRNTINMDDTISDEAISGTIKEIIASLLDKSADELTKQDIITGLDEILHSQSDEQNLAIQNYVNAIIEEGYNTVVFYITNENDIVKDSIIYVYDGASIMSLDLDENNEYHITPEVKKLLLKRLSPLEYDELEFNCIIPLYDIVNINYKSNFNTISKIVQNTEGEIDLTPGVNNSMYINNVPLGMWFYTSGSVNEDDSTSIKICYDPESGFAQSWSLTISSQFKPFPYSNKMSSDMLTNSNTNAYSTFAQVLTSQAAMVEKFIELQKEIAEIHDHISNMNSQLSNIGTSYNIDNIHREFNNFEIEMNSKFTSLKEDVLSQISYLKWHTTV